MSPPLDEARLVQLLEGASSSLVFPATPDLASVVRARIEGQEQAVARKRTSGPLWLRPAFGVAAVVLAAFAALMVSGDARRAVADLLGVVGIEISFDDDGDVDRPRPSVAPDPSGLNLGVPLGPAEAGKRAGFEVVGHRAFAGESETYFDPEVGDTGMVSTLYRPSGDRGTLLVTEFRASVDAAVAKKLAAPGSRIRTVELSGGGEAYWLSGDPHVFGYLDEHGSFRQESVRLAGDVLLWESAGITYRIEGARSAAQAVRLAARMGF